MTNFDSHYDPPDEACAVCGLNIDDCVCPSCPVCDQQGDPDCYTKHGMVLNEEQNRAIAETKARMEADVLADDAYAKSVEEDERLRLEHPEL